MRHYIPLLDRLLSEGAISEALRSAIEGCIWTIREQEWKLLYQYSAIKSQITCVDDYSCEKAIVMETYNRKLKYSYWEDGNVNVKRIGLTAYRLLDNLHHRIALKLHLPPSGSTMYIPTGEKTEDDQAIVAKVEFNPSTRASVRWQTIPRNKRGES